MELLSIQNNIKQQLLKSKINFKKSPNDKLTKSYIETRLQTIENKWTDFTRNHYKLLQVNELSESSYFEDSVYEEMEEFYIEFKSQLKELIEKQNPDPIPSDTACGVTGNVKLPKLAIPVFSGKYTEWMTFRDLFISLVHNNSSLDDVQKLHYLKSSLSGEAEQLLRHISITNYNYLQCWTMLESRYDNKQYLVNCMLNGFFSTKKILTESATAIKELLNCTLDMLHGMKSLGVNIDSWDILVIYIVCSKLDTESRKAWESRVYELLSQSNSLPDFKQFKDFLEKRFHSLEFLDHKVNELNRTMQYSNNRAVSGPSKIVTMLGVKLICIYCKGDHKLSSCKEFSSWENNAKRQFVKENRICFNCLTVNHSAKYCKSINCCKICNRRHHSLLHPKVTTLLLEQKSNNKPFSAVNSDSSQKESVTIEQDEYNINSHFTKANSQHTLLPTALVTSDSSRGETHVLRALIDQGSQSSFVTESTVQKLGLHKISNNSNIMGLGRNESIASKEMVLLTIRSRINPGYVMRVKAHVLETITSVLPSEKLEYPWLTLGRLNLADPHYDKPNAIDVLLGADVYPSVIRNGLIKSPSETAIAQNTAFGWIVSGEFEITPNV